MHQLIITLGKGQKDKKDKDLPSRYRTTCYSFPDTTLSSPSPFFGLELLRWFQKSPTKVDELIVVGTPTSMWDAWLEQPEIEQNIPDATEYYSHLGQKITNSEGVSHEDLLPLQTGLQKLFGIAVSFCIVPIAIHMPEQEAILHRIEEKIKADSTLSLDITHGLRDVTILLMLSLFHLRIVKNCHLNGIFYAAFELRDHSTEITPVVSMDFALQLFDWMRAITIADSSNSFSEIAELIGSDTPLASHLRKTGSLLCTSQLNNARTPASNALAILRDSGIQGAGSLFLDRLAWMLEWSEKNTFAQRYLAAAQRFHLAGDHLRAVILALEGFIVHHIQNGIDPMNFNAREEAKNLCKERIRKANSFPPPYAKAYGIYPLLRNFRNAVAHGSRPDGKDAAKIARILDNPEDMFTEVETWLAIINAAIQSPAPA